MEQTCKGAIISADISPRIVHVAQKWADALNTSVNAIHELDLSAGERNDIIDLAMQTTAALLAPFEPTVVERMNMAAHFHEQLRVICEQYFEDKAKAGRS